MKLGIIATQIADDAGSAFFFDELAPGASFGSGPAREDAKDAGRVSGIWTRPVERRTRAASPKAPRRRR